MAVAVAVAVEIAVAAVGPNSENEDGGWGLLYSSFIQSAYGTWFSNGFCLTAVPLSFARAPV